MLIVTLTILTTICLTISIFSFLQKGPLISELYFILSQKEREELKTKDWYYYIGTTFYMMTIILVITLMEVISDSTILPQIRMVMIVIVCLYSIIRYAQLESKRMRNKK